jgi:4'-phosphopantetheinyl transferase
MIELSAAEPRVDVWYTLVDRVDEPRIEACWEVLSDEECDRARKFAFERDRRLYLAAHAMVRTALSQYADIAPRDWRFQTIGHGKPIVDPQFGLRLRFNLSHTRGMALCGVTAGGEIGVDVEFLGRNRADLRLARRYFAPAEVAALEGRAADDLHDGFLQFWTLKESYIKAIGAGLSIALDGFAFGLSGTRPPSISFTDPAVPNACWQFAQFRIGDDHLAAVALESEPAPLTIHAAHLLPLETPLPPRPLSPCDNRLWRL